MAKRIEPLEPALGIRPNLLRWLPTRPALAFGARDHRSASQWQARARKAFAACLGDAPSQTPLNPRVLERRAFRGYARIMLTLDTAPGMRALCWLCVPDARHRIGGASPGPAMIATPGHGIGARDLLAMDAHGRPRKEGTGYQKDYALQAARLGYTTLVVEPLGFGERRDGAHRSGKTFESGCHTGANLALMLGTTLAAIRIHDLRRAMDFMQQELGADAGHAPRGGAKLGLRDFPGVDPTRIGLMGISGGGQMTLWTCALDKRFKVAIVSGYLNHLRDSILGIHHCVCNFVPGLAKQLDMPDLAAMIAPRALLIESGTKDLIFPIGATRRAIQSVRKHYRVFGAAERVVDDIFVGDHQWSGRKVGKFLRDWL